MSMGSLANGGRKAAIRLCAAILACTVASAANAQGCQRVTDTLEFCPADTSWDGMQLAVDLSDDRTEVEKLFFVHQGLTLQFSNIIEAHADQLPWLLESHAATAEVIAKLADFYSGAVVVMDPFAPLGEDVVAASIAFRAQGWLNLFTYYTVDGARLVVQTSTQSEPTVTDRHLQAHIELLRALMEIDR